MGKISKTCILAISFQLISFSFLYAQTGTWTAVRDTAPHLNYGVCLLMTDGTVICHNKNGGTYGSGWDRLTPDASGSYVNGTWDTISSMHYDRLFFSSQVLPSGKVWVAGGEYGSGDTAGEVYDPLANSWSPCHGIPSGWNLYDANSELLYNGIILEGPQIGSQPSYDCLFVNPSDNEYSIAPTAPYNHDEASWLKLPDSSVLFVGIGSDLSARYIPQTNTWIHDAVVPGNLYDPYGEEAGPAFLLPNGQALFTGATGFNAIYTPSGNTTPGTWAVADSFPIINGLRMCTPDASGAMMVNGHILMAVSPLGTSANDEFRHPTYFVEYDYTTNTFTQVTSPVPGFGTDSIPGMACYQTQMLDLPDGNVLLSVCETNHSKQYYVYTPGSPPIPEGKPTIDNVIHISCNNYYITGKLFNGISEGAEFGDDWQMETNYPLVRLTNGTNVYYARTSNWNRIGAVQTDSLEDTAYFTLLSIPGGTYSVVVVANGFASNPITLTTFGVAISAHTDLSACNTGTGSATSLAADGIPPYTYSWSPNGGTNPSASNLSSGNYTITVSDSTGCSASATVNITQAAPLTMYTTVSEITCRGLINGSAKAWVNGGTMPYTYLWSPGSNTNSLYSGLSTGTYTVFVTDSCGNSATATAVIIQPDIFGVSIDSTKNVLCYGGFTGKAYTDVSGGSRPYTYSWSGGGGTNANATTLSIGIYTVTVTDRCGNSGTAEAHVSEPAAIVNTTITFNESPGGGCDGEAVIIPSGGTPPYTYFWVGSAQTTDTIKNHCAGSYCCRVTDNQGCSQETCVDIVSGIENIVSATDGVTIYPNPNNGTFTLYLQNESKKPQIEIYNVLGEKVYRSEINTNTTQINLANRAAGLYFYRVLKEDGSVAGEGKIIIE